jgi:hypothetical protein
MRMTVGGLAALLLMSAPLALAQSPRSAAPNTPEPPPIGRSGVYSSAVTPADVKMMIEGAGYSQVTDVQQTADGYRATAVKEGKWLSLELDPAGQLIEAR